MMIRKAIDRPTVKKRQSRNRYRQCMRCAGILLLSAALLTGCWDRREIEERSSVVALGIDLVKVGEKERIRVSVQIPIPIQIASGGAGGGGGKSGLEAVRVLSSTGRSYSDAMSNLQKRVNQQLFFGHTRVIAIGEKMARKGLSGLTDALRRNPVIRRIMWPIVVKDGEGLDLLKMNPKLEQIPAVFLFTMIENGVENGSLPQLTLGRFFTSQSTKGLEPALIYGKIKENDVKIEGIAAFKGTRLVGFLYDEQMWSWLRMAQEKNGGNMTFPIAEDKPDDLITMRPHFIDSDFRFSKPGEHIQANIHIQIEADVVETTFQSQLNRPDRIKQLEKRMHEVLIRNAEGMADKIQNEFKSDILGLGVRLRAFHFDLWKQVDWEREFPNVDIRISYSIEMRRTGMEMR